MNNQLNLINPENLILGREIGKNTVTTINLESIINTLNNRNNNNKIIKNVLQIYINNGITNINIKLEDFIRITNGLSYFFRNLNVIEQIGIDNYINNTLEILNFRKIIGEENYLNISENIQNLNLNNVFNQSNRFELLNNSLQNGGMKSRYIIFIIFAILASISGIQYLKQNSINSLQTDELILSRREVLQNYENQLASLQKIIIKSQVEKKPDLQSLVRRNEIINIIKRMKKNIGENKNNIFNIIYSFLKEYFNEALLLIVGLFMDNKKGESFYKSLAKRLIFVSPNKIRKNILFLSVTEFISNYETESELDKIKKEFEGCKKEFEKCKKVSNKNKKQLVKKNKIN